MIACVAAFCTMGIQAQNWDINTLHKINSMDGKFVRNYSKAFSRSVLIFRWECLSLWQFMPV